MAFVNKARIQAKNSYVNNFTRENTRKRSIHFDSGR